MLTMLVGTVHRFWWNPHGKPISPLGILSLRCISPSTQRLWTFSTATVARQVRGIAGVCVCDARTLLEEQFAQALVNANLHICLIKDLVSALAVVAHGGLFIDLDYVWIGGSMSCFLRGTAHFAVGTEPIKTLPVQRVPRNVVTVAGVTVRVNIGVVAGVQGSPVLSAWAVAMYHHWLKRLRALGTGESAPGITRSSKQWLWNTYWMHDYIVQNGCWDALIPVHKVAPWPLWMRQWLPPGSLTHGYKVPSVQLLVKEGVLLNMWESQLFALQCASQLRDVATDIRQANGLPKVSLMISRDFGSLQGTQTHYAGPGQPPRAPLALSKAIQPGRLAALLAAAECGPDRLIGWTSRGFVCRTMDIKLLAALSLIPFKGLASHLYNAARECNRTPGKPWGPFSTIFLLRGDWKQLQTKVALTRCYSIWLVLSGAIEVALPRRAPLVCRAGEIVASDALRHGGRVARILDSTVVLWCTVPDFMSSRCPTPGQLTQVRRMSESVRAARASGRRKRGHMSDPRRRKLPACNSGFMYELLQRIP